VFTLTLLLLRAVTVDTRGTPRVYASSCNPFFGMKVLRSTDLAKSRVLRPRS
jgi:hypothetical protein